MGLLILIDSLAEWWFTSVDVSISPKQVIKGMTIPTVAIDDIDFTWFTPGGGGAISYCPFPN